MSAPQVRRAQAKNIGKEKLNNESRNSNIELEIGKRSEASPPPHPFQFLFKIKGTLDHSRCGYMFVVKKREKKKKLTTG